MSTTRHAVRALTSNLRVLERKKAKKSIRLFIRESLRGHSRHRLVWLDEETFRIESHGEVYQAFVTQATIFGPGLFQAEIQAVTNDGLIPLGTIQLGPDEDGEKVVDFDDLPPEPFLEPGSVPDDTTGAAPKASRNEGFWYEEDAISPEEYGLSDDERYEAHGSDEER